MTLALYGKSRRRQGALVFAGFMAVVVAILVAVASMVAHSAHAASAWSLNPAHKNATNPPSAGFPGYASCPNPPAGQEGWYGWHFAMTYGQSFAGLSVTFLNAGNKQADTASFPGLFVAFPNNSHAYVWTPGPDTLLSGGAITNDLGGFDTFVNLVNVCVPVSVTKDKSQTSEPPTWNITITNGSDSSQPLFIKDAGSTYNGIVSGNGSCSATAGETSMTAGIHCGINSKSTLVIGATKATPAATCGGSEVDNTVEVWIWGEGTPTSGADFTDSSNNKFTYPGVASYSCITFTKVYSGSGVWTITFTNTGPQAEVNFSDTYEPNGTGTDINSHAAGGCEVDGAPGTLNIQGCNVTVAAGTPGVPVNTTTTVTTDTFQCGEARNTVTAFFGASSGPPIGVDFATHEDTNCRLPSGNLRIEKHMDINRDGDSDDPGEGLLEGWPITIDGPVIGGTHETGSFPHPANILQFDGLDSEAFYDITEATPAGWVVVKTTVNGANAGAVSSLNDVDIPEGGTTVVRFYNSPIGSITVHKDTINVVNNIETPNLGDDDGWRITATSAACGVSVAGVTDASGNITFTGLELCGDYVVAEDLTQPGAPGYSPVGASSRTGIQPGFGEPTLVTFTNETRTRTGSCSVNCTTTTVNPTPTAVPPTAAPPTNTPVTGGNPPVTQVAGAQTPGPGATPIAPSTGDGLFGGSAAGLNLLLVLGGLIAVMSGAAVVALGRRR